MSLTLTSLLTIYIKSMLPQTLFEWEVPFGVQICGIMGLGLLYAGSGDRYISEIGKLPVRLDEPCRARDTGFLIRFLAPVKKKWSFSNAKRTRSLLASLSVPFYSR
jgi:hypothetical protein